MNDPGELCAACGLCCDGTLFDRVAVRPEEAPALVALGLPVAARADGSLGMPQPCASLEGTLCRAYDVRPATCRDYECLLFRAYRDDEVTLADALATIAETRRIKASGDRAALELDVARHYRGRFGRRG